MTAAKHTPGPWFWRGFGLHADQGRWKANALLLSCDEMPCAENGALIAAAPDLLAALEAVTVDLDNLAEGEACDHRVGICWCSVFQGLDDARAAIAKAKGGVS